MLIVGGGIGGLTLASALRQRGVEPQIIERAPAWAPVGAGIVLSVNAMRVLRALGMADALAARGCVVQRAAVADSNGKVIVNLDIRAAGEEGDSSVAIHRAALHEVLCAAVDGTPLRLGTTFAALDFRGQEVAVRFTDGTSSEYDLVVGADGLRSQVRDVVFGTNPPRYSGYTCWRLVVPAPPGLSHPVEMWGRGKRFGLVPIGDRLVYCYATANAPPATPDAPEARVERFRVAFGGFGGAVPAVLRRIERPEQLMQNDIEEVIQTPWHRGGVVLLGDAAHASTPDLGQGAAMAIEDAAVLAEELGRGQPLARALAAYTRRRAARVRRVQDQSRRLGRVGQWQSALACALRDRLLRLLPARAAAASLRRLIDAPI